MAKPFCAIIHSQFGGGMAPRIQIGERMRLTYQMVRHTALGWGDRQNREELIKTVIVRELLRQAETGELWFREHDTKVDGYLNLDDLAKRLNGI